MDKDKLCRAYEAVASAKSELIEAIRLLQCADAPTVLVRQAEGYCAKVETFQRKLSTLARG